MLSALYLDDHQAARTIHALLRSAQMSMYSAQVRGAMHPGDELISAREDIILARKISSGLPQDMIPSRLPVMERAITIALERGARHEGIK
jgi:hypothetical protein